MKDFRLFDIYDFLMDEDFIRWVRFRKKEDNDFWYNWLEQYPEKHIVITEARSILEIFEKQENPVTESEKQAEITKLIFTIKGNTPKLLPAAKVKHIWFSKKNWYVAASLFIVILSCFIYFSLSGNTRSGQYNYTAVTPSKRLIENVNTSEKAVTLRLPDESEVTLSANSRIAYASDFDSTSTRDIYLLGEAIFTVTKNPSRPFRVFANEIVTKVLGTSFVVRSFENDSTIKVTVKSGKVSVYSQSETKETAIPNRLGSIILTPNQELVYQKEKQKFQKTLLNNPLMVVPEEADKKLLYEDTPLELVFDQLGKNYGVNIVFDNDVLKKCTITADLRTVPFYEKLDLICKAIGASYEEMDGQVVIQTGGCQ
jgi:ferric-dicitrate binding protein FerR (iron transport regulator)